MDGWDMAPTKGVMEGCPPLMGAPVAGGALHG